MNTLQGIGAVCFGVVIGWVTYRTLRHTDKAAVSDIATVIGAVGGAAVTTLFSADLFGLYAIGLAAGFFGYLILAFTAFKDVEWLGDGS